MTDAAYLTTGEVADLFRVTRYTVARWCDTGRIACIHTPTGHRRIPRAEVDKWFVPEPPPLRLVAAESA